MDISCSQCKTNFILPDDRVPDTKKFKLNCPKCRAPIIVDLTKSSILTDTIVENFPYGSIVAFVFSTNTILNQRIKNVLRKRSILVSESIDPVEAIQKIRVNYYNILILEDIDELDLLHETIKKWNGLRRREVNIVLVNSTVQTFHSHESFMRGVNFIISEDDNDEIEKYLELSLDGYTKQNELWNIAAQKLHIQG